MRKPKSRKIFSQRKNFVKSARKQYGNPDSHAFSFYSLKTLTFLPALKRLLNVFRTRYIFFSLQTHTKLILWKRTIEKKRIKFFNRSSTKEGAPGSSATQSAFQTRLTRTAASSQLNWTKLLSQLERPYFSPILRTPLPRTFFSTFTFLVLLGRWWPRGALKRLTWLIFSDFCYIAMYWNSGQIKLLIINVWILSFLSFPCSSQIIIIIHTFNQETRLQFDTNPFLSI